MEQSFDRRPSVGKLWVKNFKDFKSFSTNHKIAETEESITLEETPIPLKFVTTIIFATFVVSMITIWLSNLDIGKKVLTTFLGIGSSSVFIVIIYALDAIGKKNTSFRVDKLHRVLMVDEKTALLQRDIVFFCLYLTFENNYPMVLLSVGFFRNSEVVEYALVALSGSLEHNAEVGEKLANFFCAPLLNKDVRKDVKLSESLLR